MARAFDLLVFDWDGTLIDSAGAIAGCIQEACRDLGLEVPDEERARHVIGLGLGDALAHAIPGLDPSQYGRVVERYRHHFLRRDPDIALFPGTAELIAALASRGHLLAIATGKSRTGLARSLATTGLAPYFTSTRCADQCASKPAPEMLHELMEELDVPARATLMIGDTVHDLDMAANAGVASVAIAHGAHPKNNLLARAPLACVGGTEELAQWLARNG